MNSILNLHAIANSIVFAIIGSIILLIAYWVIEKLTPENTWHEIIKNKNIALAIIMASCILGLSIIIGCAIHG